VTGIQVSLQLAPHQKVLKAFLLSPEQEGSRSLIVTEQDGRALITVPELRTYALAVVQTE
jgi:hypothetical protein